MPGIAQYNFDRFSDFISEMPSILFNDGMFRRGCYLFRGQGDWDFRLEASFDRRFRDLKASERVARYSELITNLREEFGRLGMPGCTEAEMLGFAQHYGTPTRLLDWSSSPFVASYFAFHGSVSSASPSRYVSVWAIDQTVAAGWKELGVEIIRLEGLKNLRANRQLGYATNLKTPDNALEDFVDRLGLSEPALYKFNIQADDSLAAFSFLDACNTRASELFGGEEGASRTAFERLVLGHQMRA